MIILKTIWLMIVVICVVAMLLNPVGWAIILFLGCYWVVKKQEEEKQNEND
jgi:hypothetical protein